jgi:hypothetical protein
MTLIRSIQLVQLERILIDQGFKVSKYLTPGECKGFALSHPALSGKAEMVILQEGNKYKVFLSTLVTQHGLNPLSPVNETNFQGVIELALCLTKDREQTKCKKLLAEITKKLNSFSYEKLMSWVESYKFN